MDRLVPTLLFILIVVVTGVGVVVWRADVRAHEDAARALCLQRAQTTAVIALLAPAGRVDADGRVSAIRALGRQVEKC